VGGCLRVAKMTEWKIWQLVVGKGSKSIEPARVVPFF